jgi:Domain of unknown function (DUF6379)
VSDLLAGPFRRTGEGYDVPLRFDWYRSLPLSCVAALTLTLDGEPVAAEDMAFHVNDRDHALDELAELHDEFWFVLDPARIRVRTDEPLAPGEHDIAVELSMRIPYLFDEETGEVLTLWWKPQARKELV